METSTNVVITGAGSGIGQACTASFAATGAQIFAMGRRPEPLAKLRADFGEAVQPLSLDVGDAAAVHAAFAALPPVQVLVANAGLCATAALDDPEADEVWRAVLRTNLDGVYYCLRAALPRLVDGGRVKIGRASCRERV